MQNRTQDRRKQTGTQTQLSRPDVADTRLGDTAINKTKDTSGMDSRKEERPNDKFLANFHNETVEEAAVSPHRSRNLTYFMHQVLGSILYCLHSFTPLSVCRC